MAKVISLACIKGGVGKTTSAVSLGGILADRGKKVLLVDIDPLHNTTRTFFENDFDKTIIEAFRGECPLPVVNVRKNLDLVPSCAEACAIETQFLSRADALFFLKDLLEPVRDSYDWIFVDCPAQLGVSTGNALVAADYLLVPITPDAYSIDGLDLIFEYSKQTRRFNPGMKTLGVVLTKFHERYKSNRHVRDEIAEAFGDLLFPCFIRDTNSLGKAPLYLQDIWTFDKSSAGAEDYSALLDEILKRIRTKKFQ